jgi:cell division protein FtsI/penicillin-binding protein 2
LVAAIRAPGSATVVARNPSFGKPVDLGTEDQWNVIYDGMVGAVSQPGATAYLAFRGALYKLAGKTGTAQVVTVKQTESTKHQDADVRKREHAWFIAFAPVDDPKIAISVLIENGGFGGSTAGPIARKVLDMYLLGDAAVAEPKKTP